ncbi:hypothetical protein DACRYDRAFT_91571 [Dacryopinax primogenitus]|uniref:Uncharacterized protein n=1 Tax=Dacryopinax primogenitus (strain DJM 731) TaxID=1858805 RepID=M5FNN3_DACPD|nr:uncharacterized protein DACRYDRAFT_91571 [Dacryopinax primogenitus]EJT97720.1 hypothetical protein DACRYDRAFT_91571 [Dacryopinax primogenitus]
MREIQRDMKEEQERKAMQEAGSNPINGRETSEVGDTNTHPFEPVPGAHEASSVAPSAVDENTAAKEVIIPAGVIDSEKHGRDESEILPPESEIDLAESQLPDWSSSQIESQMDGLEESQISQLVTPSMSISQQVPLGDESQTPESQIVQEQVEEGEEKEEIRSEGVVKDQEMDGSDDKTTITAPTTEPPIASVEATGANLARPDPEPNRISISYASSSRRIVIDSSTIQKIRIFRQEGRIEITVVVQRRGEADDFKGILFEAETSEHDFVQIVPSAVTCADATVPPLYTVLRPADEEPETILLQVFVDKDRPLSEPKWVKTGDVNDHIGPDRDDQSTVPSWKGKIEVIDPDKPKMQTLETILDGWAINSVIAQQKDRERFLSEHMRGQPDNLLEILLRLVRGERASVATHIHPFSLSGPLAAAMPSNADHAHQQTHVSLAVVALYRIAVDYAKKAGAEEKEVSDKAGDIIKSIPSHLVWKALDGMFRDWLQTQPGGSKRPHHPGRP